MSIGELMNDELFIARMNYTIGRVYGFKQDYDTSIYFHEKHLQLARQLHDSIGQCRAYYTLSQLNEKINQVEKAKKYDSLYRALSREVRRHLSALSLSVRIAARFRSTNRSTTLYPCRPDRHRRITCSRYVSSPTCDTEPTISFSLD